MSPPTWHTQTARTCRVTSRSMLSCCEGEVPLQLLSDCVYRFFPPGVNTSRCVPKAKNTPEESILTGR